jgi:hypothetical protein
MNSYELEHQKSGTNQFCQSFAILYMISNYSRRKINKDYKLKENYLDKLKSGSQYFGANIRVVIEFWRFIFTYHPPTTEWLIEQVRTLNNEYIKEATSRESFIISQNSNDIDIVRIRELLDDIDTYAHQIAENT